MDTEYIIIKEYCEEHSLDPDFIVMLAEEGLIELRITAGEECLPFSQLGALERYARMYYDLSINIPGIDAIHNLLEQIEELRREIRQLHDQLSLYKKEDEEEIW